MYYVYTYKIIYEIKSVLEFHGQTDILSNEVHQNIPVHNKGHITKLYPNPEM